MNFRGHLVGGVAVGIGVAEVSSHLGYIPPDDRQIWAGVFGTAVFFSLFPDLDTSSVPQRWFFRIVFALLIFLGWTQQYELATLVGILSLLPLLDHHRGWTHRKFSPLVVALLLGTVYECWQAGHGWSGAVSWGGVRKMIESHFAFFVACVAGWYSHLLLDGRFRLFPTDSEHH